MKYGNMTWGKMEAVINKLGGMEAVDLLLKDKLLITEKPDNTTQEITRVVNVGLEKVMNAIAYVRDLETTKPGARSLLEAYEIREEQFKEAQHYNYHIVRPLDLRLPANKGITYDGIRGAIRERGYTLCTVEAMAMLIKENPLAFLKTVGYSADFFFATPPLFGGLATRDPQIFSAGIFDTKWFINHIGATHDDPKWNLMDKFLVLK